MSSTRPSPTHTALQVQSNDEVDARRKALFGESVLATKTASELVIHKDSKEVIALVDQMFKNEDFSPIQTFGQDIISHLATVTNATSMRLIEIDKASAESNVGQTSQKLANLADELDYEKIAAPLEKFVKRLGLTKAAENISTVPILGSIIRKLVLIPNQDKITEVVKNIEGMLDQREPMLESLYGRKDNLEVAAFTTIDMMHELGASRHVLGDRLIGAGEIVAAIEARKDEYKDPLDKKKHERMLNAATRMQRGIQTIDIVTAKAQMQGQNSLALSEELVSSVGEAIVVLPAVLNTGASALMTTVAASRAAEDLSLTRNSVSKLLAASDNATAQTIRKVEEIGREGIVNTKELKEGITKLIAASKKIREVEAKRVTATKGTTAEMANLTAALDQELQTGGAPTPSRKERKQKNVTPDKDEPVVDI